jgi:hypothetical protein
VWSWPADSDFRRLRYSKDIEHLYYGENSLAAAFGRAPQFRRRWNLASISRDGPTFNDGRDRGVTITVTARLGAKTFDKFNYRTCRLDSHQSSQTPTPSRPPIINDPEPPSSYPPSISLPDRRSSHR